MGDVDPVPCATFRAELPEVALGVLEPLEVGGLQEHLDACASCRAELAELSATADRLVLVTPEVEPPAAFAQRTLESIAAPIVGSSSRPTVGTPSIATGVEPSMHSASRRPGRGRPARRRTRVLAVVAAAAAVVVVGGAAVIVDRHGAPDRIPVETATPSALLVTHHGRAVGRVQITSGDPAAMTVWIDGVTPGLEYRCEAVLADGSRELVGAWTVGTAPASWTVDLSAAASAARRVELSREDGTPVASAVLPT